MCKPILAQGLVRVKFLDTTWKTNMAREQVNAEMGKLTEKEAR